MDVLSGAAAASEVLCRIYQLSRLILERARSFRKAPALLCEIQDFTHDLLNGQLQYCLQYAERSLNKASSGPEGAREQRVLVERHLRKLQGYCEDADGILNRCVDKNGQVNRLIFTCKEKKLKHVLENWLKWQSQFFLLIVLLEKTRPLCAKDRHLTARSFLLTTKNYEGFMGVPLALASHAILASAEYKDDDDKMEEVGVIIELQVAADGSALTAHDTVKEIANHLGRGFPSGGILQCLGYRVEPGLQLVFRIPPHLSNPRSLASLISKVDETASSSKPSVWSRLDFAKRLAEAVLSVHGANMVHKSIRPDTILVFETRDQTESLNDAKLSLGIPVLTCWSMTRKVDELSARSGDSDWAKNLYRHPQRYGLQLEKRYHIGHDLYSLGICLLECGLWEPLLLRDVGRPASMSSRYCDMAQKLKCIDYREATELKISTNAAIIKKVLFGLTEQDLSECMGQGYADMVKACMNRAEDLGSLEKSGVSQSEVTSAYHEWILQPLAHLLSQTPRNPTGT